MSTLQECRDALGSPNVQAFLRVIRAGESGQGDNAYRMMFGGGLFDSFDDHPNRSITRGALTSTAAGAYQFLNRTWREVRDVLSLPDFSPPMQDLAAVYLIRRRGALADVLAGRISDAIERCNHEWASLPGSPYGQPTRTLAQALATYAQYGGTLAGQATTPPPPPIAAPTAPTPAPQAPLPRPNYAPAGEGDAPEQQEKPMAPFIAAALPALIELVPKLGSLFGSGSDVANRNIKAAEVVVKAAKEAIGARNEQELVETIKADPAAAADVKKAVEARWLDITEAGGGGVEGARKADVATQTTGDIKRSASFWIALLMLPLVYLLVLSLIGLIGTATWSDDVRAGLAGSLISAIVGGLIGYYYGQTTSRNRSST